MFVQELIDRDVLEREEAPRLGCLAYELEPGDKFSIDGGYSWLTCETVADSREQDNATVINTRDDNNRRIGLVLDSYKHVLLHQPGEEEHQYLDWSEDPSEEKPYKTFMPKRS
jgi:hypothetical protein